MLSAVPRPRRRITSLAAVTLALGVLALAAPLGESEYPAARIGALLALAAIIEALHSLRRSTAAARREATVSAIISMAIALFLINAPLLAGQALRLVIAGWFGFDAVRYAIDLLRGDERKQRSVTGLAALGNLAVVLLILLAPGWLSTMIVALAGALRIFGIAWNIIVAPVYTSAEADQTVIGELGLTDYPGAAAMAAEVEAAERTRAPIDRGWTLSFIATLFAIHLGRMSTDLTLLSMVAPAVAVAGDMLIAVLFTLLVINPTYLLWRGPTRWIERRAWRWQLDRGDARRSWIDRVVVGWLRWRLTMAIRMRELRYSVPAALASGLQRGLPFAAIIAATVPVWGMSWYFDTENWAAGMWNSWAESRTDTWRASMVRAVLASQGGVAGPTSFAVGPGRRLRGFLVRRHRRHGRRRRLSTCVARSVADRGQQPRRPLRGDLVRRRVPVRRDARLRSEVLAAFQGRHTAGLCDTWQSRLVRRARSLQRDVPPGRRRACQHTGPRGVRSPPDQHDRRTDRAAHRGRGPAAPRIPASRPASSARRSSRCRQPTSPSSRSTPA